MNTCLILAITAITAIGMVMTRRAGAASAKPWRPRLAHNQATWNLSSQAYLRRKSAKEARS